MNYSNDHDQSENEETRTLFGIDPVGIDIDHTDQSKISFLNEIKRRLDKITQDGADNRAIMLNTHSVLTLAQAKLSEEIAELVRTLHTMNNLDIELEELKRYTKELEVKLEHEALRLKEHTEREKAQASLIDKMEVMIRNYNSNFNKVLLFIVLITIVFIGHVILTW